MEDPIVAEVRRIREEIAAEFDFDIRRIGEDARRRQFTWGSKVVSFVSPDGKPLARPRVIRPRKYESKDAK